MTSVSKHLKKPIPKKIREEEPHFQAEKKTKIILKVSDNGNYIRYTTSYSIFPHHWDYEKKQVKRNDSKYSTINKRLEDLEDELTEAYNQLKKEGVLPTLEKIKEIIYPKPVDEIKELTFWDYYKEREERKSLEWSSKTKQNQNVIKSKLQEYENKKGVKLNIDTIDKKVLSDIRNYFVNDRKLKNTTVNQYLKGLRTFLNWCNDEKLTSNTDYKGLKELSEADNCKEVYSLEELQKLRETSFKTDYLNNAKQLFLISCLTGLRFSDYSNIPNSYISNNILFITVIKTKGRETLEIPLTTESKQLIEDVYSGVIRIISNQKMNDYIKVISKELGMTNEVTWVEYEGSERVDCRDYRYNKIGSHTGRRTFATNLMLKGVSPFIIIKYTGHDGFDSFKRYVNIPKVKEHSIVREALENEQVKQSLELD